jgi:hypothetical protein
MPTVRSTGRGSTKRRTFHSRKRQASGNAPQAVIARWPQQAGGNITIMRRRAYLIFGDIEGKLDVLCVECTKCARKGRYSVRKIIEKYGRRANLMK